MAKWKKIIVAGPLVMEAVYPRANSKDAPKVRAAKKKLSSEAQMKMNLKYSYQKLEFLLAANFCPGDLVCTMTYKEGCLPSTRKEAEARLKYFRAKLSAHRKKHKVDFRMAWCSEHRHGLGRWHHHCVINSTGEDIKQLQRLWPYGHIEITTLKIDKDHSYEGLARYMAKEEKDKVGQRSWSYTRSCKQPEVETFIVPDDTPLQAPKGSIVIEQASEATAYGSFKYVKYLASSTAVRRRVKARRRVQRK